MHTKKIGIIITTLMVLATLVAMLPLHSAMADYPTPTPTVYDEIYVSQGLLGVNTPGQAPTYFTGSDVTGTGSKMNPYRTITRALKDVPKDGGNPDRINVGPSGQDGWYGGAVPENIIIDSTLVDKTGGKGLVITSYDPATGNRGGILNDPNKYRIDVTSQRPVPKAVIEVIGSSATDPAVMSGTYVTIDGLFLTGAASGIWAHNMVAASTAPSPLPYIERTQVDNCIIKIDQVEDGVGIEMYNVKWPVINNNQIFVGSEGAPVAGPGTLSVDAARGIILNNCYSPDSYSTVTKNVLNIHGDTTASGMEITSCPHSAVNNNTVNVLAAGDVRGTGIWVTNSPLITVSNNTLDIEENGNTWSIAYGIRVGTSAQATLNADNVKVVDNMQSQNFGFLFARGIAVVSSSGSQVTNCPVTVQGNANGNQTSAVITSALTADELNDLADLNQMDVASLGIAHKTIGIGTVIGIRVRDSDMVTVSGNTLNPISLNLQVTAGANTGAASACGDGEAVGILACDSGAFKATGNTVQVNSTVLGQATAIAGNPAAGFAQSEGLGIALMDCGSACVTGNNVQAEGDLTSNVTAVASFAETQSALARISANVVGAINQALSQIQTDSNNIKLSGDVASIQSYGDAGSDAVGIGVEIISCDKAVVSGNQSSGIGNLISTVQSNAAKPDPTVAAASAGGMGLGIGISIQDSRGVLVDKNNPVVGTGTATLWVGAKQASAKTNTYADGCGAGIGVGIMLCGQQGYDTEAEALGENMMWNDRPTVSNNFVTALGKANPVTVSAIDLVSSQNSVACGSGMGLALGITAWSYPCVMINNNTVNATGNGNVTINSQATTTLDPFSNGNAAGIGVGISTVFCFHATIQNNGTIGKGTAYANVGSTQLAIILGAASKGASLGFGEGVLAVDCCFVTIGGNTGNGVGDAETKIIATNAVPLDWAGVYSMTAGIGNGIGAVGCYFGKIIDCNFAAGAGSARLTSSAQADFSDNDGIAVNMSIDILWVLQDPGSQAIDESRSDFSGVVNYNSMVDVAPAGSSSTGAWMFSVDAGLLKIGCFPLDAQFNYWNDTTGPKFISGQGEELMWCGAPVCFEPWLYECCATTISDQLGYFGFTIPIVKGLNTLSTPIALEQVKVNSRKWSDIVANSNLGGKVKYADRWDGATQKWVSVGPNDTLDPLDAWYVYFYDTAGPNVILLVNTDMGHPYAMPTRTVNAGWDLISANPLFNNEGLKVSDATSSIKLTPAGTPGYTQVISPVVKGQNAWIYTPGDQNCPWMDIGRGYWIYTQNNDTLAGFGFTPLPETLTTNH